MEWKVKPYDALTKNELYKILKARARVFVEEQVCAYVDADDRDQQSVHMWAEIDGALAAYIRILSPKAFDGVHCSIGRVITAAEYRGQGLGQEIMQRGIRYCDEKYPNTQIKISAQYYLLRFYSALGFEQQGAIYLEDGMPHIAMKK